MTDLDSLLHSGYAHKTVRGWQSGPRLAKSRLVLPVFLSQTSSQVASMPGVQRHSIGDIDSFFGPLVRNGLQCVLLFGSSDEKDSVGSHADADSSLVVQ